MRLLWFSSAMTLACAAAAAPLPAAAQPQLVGDGRTDNTAAFEAIFASTSSPTIHLEPGTYRVSCHKFVAASAISLVGSGRESTVIQLPRNCATSADLFSWTNFPGVSVQDFTIDMNSPVNTRQPSALAFYTARTGLQGPTVSNVGVINDTAPGFGIRVTVLLAGAFPGTASWVNPVITNSYISYVTASGLQNQCICLGGTGFGDNVSVGFIHGPKITSNTCVKSAIQYDGDHGLISKNTIKDWSFGSGIFMQFDAKDPMSIYPTSDSNNLISDNIITGGVGGQDVNGTTATGIENNCVDCVISGNDIHDNYGVGILQYGNSVVIEHNKIYDNARQEIPPGQEKHWGNYMRSGIELAVSGVGEPYRAKSVTIQDNQIFDSGKGTQEYAYSDRPGIDGPVVLKRNSMSGSRGVIHQTSPKGVLRVSGQ